jgi:hypothetical protein
MGMIPQEKLKELKDLYYGRKYCMREVAKALGVGMNAVTNFMDRNNLPRRSFSEIDADRFARKKPSFSIRKVTTEIQKRMQIAGVMLYWCEGFKSPKGAVVDFVNSDPDMIRVFLRFLRSNYKLQESKLRVLLYGYSDQDIPKLIRFWNNVTHIPKKQFTKPYIRKDFRKDGRKMPYGLIHVRYADKKLLLELKRLIQYYVSEFKRA